MRRALPWTALLAVVAILLPAPVAGAADRYKRSFAWSGYRWTVRSTTGRADPGHNRWGDSPWNVRVQRDGTLRVNIYKGKAVEVVGPRTGYGRYRWVVRSDLSTVDPWRVAAFFVRGTRREHDIEFSRWGSPQLSTAGTWVTWRRNTRLGFDFFAVPAAPPYTIIIDWRIGATTFAVRDGTGATLLNKTLPSSQGGQHIAPRISYWLFPGRSTQRSRYTLATVHPPIVVESFRYTKLRS